MSSNIWLQLSKLVFSNFLPPSWFGSWRTKNALKSPRKGLYQVCLNLDSSQTLGTWNLGLHLPIKRVPPDSWNSTPAGDLNYCLRRFLLRSRWHLEMDSPSTVIDQDLHLQYESFIPLAFLLLVFLISVTAWADDVPYLWQPSLNPPLTEYLLNKDPQTFRPKSFLIIG